MGYRSFLVPFRRASLPAALALLPFTLGTGCASRDEAEEPPGNLLLNGSFEMWGEGGPAGWEIDQKGFNERIDAEGGAFHGRVAAAVSCFLPDEYIILRQTVPLTAQRPHRASLHVRAVTPPRESRLLLVCLDASGAPTASETRPIGGQAGQWRGVACDLLPPTGTVAVRYEIRIGPNARGQLLVDGARLEPVPEAKPKP